MALFIFRSFTLSAALLISLGACSDASDASSSDQSEAALVYDEAQITVTGETDAVERFAALQSSRTPALKPKEPKTLDDVRVEATFLFPDGTKPCDLVDTTREALAAGLDYSTTHTRSETLK